MSASATQDGHNEWRSREAREDAQMMCWETATTSRSATCQSHTRASHAAQSSTMWAEPRRRVAAHVGVTRHESPQLHVLTSHSASEHSHFAFLRHRRADLWTHVVRACVLSTFTRYVARTLRDFYTSVKYTPCLKNVPPLACYNFDTHEWILTFFGRNVTDKVGNQKTLYNATSNNLCFCITWQNRETWKSPFSLSWTVLDAHCTCAMSFWKLKEKKLSSVMCLIASNICWDSKISH